MQLARVIGTVVATEKADGLEGVKFLIIQPLDRHQEPAGSPVVAALSMLSRKISTLYLPFGKPSGFEMWNSVQASPVGAID